MPLEEELNRKKNEIGLVGAPLKFRIVSNANKNITAFIDPKDWHIEITVNESFNPVPDRQTRLYVKQKNIARPLWRICEDILVHELGHWELPRASGYGCPYNSGFWDEIIDGTNKALSELNMDPKVALSTGQTLEEYVGNAFSDIVNNVNCKQHTTHSGQALFFNEQGLSSEGSKYPKFYEAFVKLNLFLWGDSIDQRLLERFHTNDEKVIATVRQVMKALGLGRDFGKNLQTLFRKEDWNTMAYKFALATAKLIEPSEKQAQLFGAAKNGPEASFQFRDEKEEVVYGRYSSGKGPARHTESFEQLDLLYRRLSKEIPINVQTLTETLSFPVAPFGRQRFDPEVHDLRRKRIRGFAIDEQGGVTIKIPRGDILTLAGYRRNVREFPKLKVVVLDTSGSMKTDPSGSDNVGSTKFIPWGDNSKYHYALKGWYGVQNFLEQQGFAPYVDNSLLNFSDRTIASGRQRPENLQEVKKLALNPQFGGTVLDVEVLKKQLGTDAFLLSISDGEINNWGSIREAYGNAVKGTSYAHIQIGAENHFTRDLAGWNFPVYFVKGDEDLSRLMVQVASRHYLNHAFRRIEETRSVI